MTLKEILDFVNFNINKTQEGNAISSREFNTLLSVFNVKMFEDEVAAVELQAKSQGVDTYSLIYSHSPLRPFRVKAEIDTLEGSADLPDDYQHYISFLAKFDSQERRIDVVSENEMNRKKSSLIESSFMESPIVVIYSDKMDFLPKTIGADSPVEMVYLKIPSTPYYDECIVSYTGVMVYMPAGSYITSTPGAPSVANLYSSEAVLIQAGVEHEGWVFVPGNPAPTYTSKTTELEWDYKMQLVLINHLISAASTNLRLLNQNAK